MAIKKTYGELIFENGSWVIPTLQPHVCIALKNIFPKLSKGSSVPFKFTDTPESCADLNWFISRYPLKITKECIDKLQVGENDYVENLNRIASILLPEYKAKKILLNDGMTARDYQLKGAEVSCMVSRLLIGDDLGLGKTLTAILVMMKDGALPAFVVPPPHLTEHWEEQIAKFTNLKTHVIKTKKLYDLPPADVYILTYTKLQGWVDIFQDGFAKTVVFEEVHELRHSDTDKYRAARKLAETCQTAIGLSATPIFNYGNEIWNIMNLLKPGSLGPFNDFSREWTSNGKIVTDPQALGTYLRDNYLMLRRTRHDVGMEMPKVNTIVHEIDYDQSIIDSEESLIKSLAIAVTTGSFTERGEAARELDIKMRLITGLSKAKYVAEFVKMFLNNNEPVLLGGWHRSVYDIWLEELKDFKPVLFTGSETAKQKNISKRAFMSGETNLMIMSLRSGIGVDGLQHRCSNVTYGELDWSPKVHEQFTARIDRPGQKDPVMACFLTTNFGSDELMINRLGLKASQSHGIIDPQLAMPEQYSDDTRIKLLAQQILKRYN